MGKDVKLKIECGQELLRLRKEHHMTQDEVADKLGVTKKCISSWEHNRTQPNSGQLQKLSEVFGCKVEGMELFQVALTKDEYETLLIERKSSSPFAKERAISRMYDYVNLLTQKTSPMDVTEGERKLILELRENKGTSVDDLTEKFNAILKHRANNNPIDIEEPAIYEIRVEQYLGKKRK